MLKIGLASICSLLLLTNLGLAQTETVSPKVFSLDQCVELAVKNNATLIAAKNSYNVAKSDVWTGWGRLLPNVNSDIGYSRRISWNPGGRERYAILDTMPPYILGVVDAVVPPGIGKTKSYSASISAGQNWSLGGYDFYSIKEKNATRDSKGSSYQLARQELILSVKQAYFDVLKAKMLLGIQEKALKRAEEQLKIAQTRYDLGSASFSDVLKAKVLHGDVKLALITAENTLKLTKASLNSWMAQNVDLPIEIEENLSQPTFDYSYEDALKQAIVENPNVNIARLSLSSAEAQMGMARSGFFPNFNLQGSYSWSNQDLDEIKYIRRRNYDWNLSASISFTIFENFTRKQNLSYAKANLNSSKENLRQTKNDVALQLKQAFLGVQQAQEKTSLTKDKLQSAQEDLDLMQEKYNLGAASILELLDAEVSYKQAESDQVQALYDYNLAVAQFEKAIGK